jgi:hypothetical protein
MKGPSRWIDPNPARRREFPIIGRPSSLTDAPAKRTRTVPPLLPLPGRGSRRSVTASASDHQHKLLQMAIFGCVRR